MTVGVNEGEGDPSDFSDGDLEQSAETRKRSPPSLPFAGRKSKSREIFDFYSIGDCSLLTSFVPRRQAPRKGLGEWFASDGPSSL